MNTAIIERRESKKNGSKLHLATEAALPTLSHISLPMLKTVSYPQIWRNKVLSIDKYIWCE